MGVYCLTIGNFQAKNKSNVSYTQSAKPTNPTSIIYKIYHVNMLITLCSKDVDIHKSVKKLDIAILRQNATCISPDERFCILKCSKMFPR